MFVLLFQAIFHAREAHVQIDVRRGDTSSIYPINKIE